MKTFEQHAKRLAGIADTLPLFAGLHDELIQAHREAEKALRDWRSDLEALKRFEQATERQSLTPQEVEGLENRLKIFGKFTSEAARALGSYLAILDRTSVTHPGLFESAG